MKKWLGRYKKRILEALLVAAAAASMAAYAWTGQNGHITSVHYTQTEEDLAALDWDNILQVDPPDGITVSLDDFSLEEGNPYEGKSFSVLGDSYSGTHAGFWWAAEEYRWWGVVAKRLGMRLEVNNSTFGIAIWQLTDQPEQLGEDPDVIFLMMGANDYKDGDRKIIYDEYVELIERVRANYPDAQLVCVTYPYRMTNDRFVGCQEYVNKIIRKAAKKERVLLADTDTKTYDNVVDGVHTNPEGSYYLGNKVADILLADAKKEKGEER